MRLSRRSALLGLLCAPLLKILPTLPEPVRRVLSPLDKVFTRHAYNTLRPGYKDNFYTKRPMLELLRAYEGKEAPATEYAKVFERKAR